MSSYQPTTDLMPLQSISAYRAHYHTIPYHTIPSTIPYHLPSTILSRSLVLGSQSPQAHYWCSLLMGCTLSLGGVVGGIVTGSLRWCRVVSGAVLLSGDKVKASPSAEDRNDLSVRYLVRTVSICKKVGYTYLGSRSLNRSAAERFRGPSFQIHAMM